MKKSDQQKIYNAFNDTIWMAIRYANGRSSYAPSMVRKAIKQFQEVYPDWRPKFDLAIKADIENGWAGNSLSRPEDFLVDLFEDDDTQEG